MRPEQNLKLSGSDIEAILAALPIVENTPAATPAQQMLNHLSCQGARRKLQERRKDFTPNELRVIAVSVCYASEFLSGRMQELGTLLSDTSVIRKYALSYVRLNSYFLPQIEALDK